ncbi:Ppx/GppA phosphatase family protein [Aminomonas paucivorans]|uniref:Ppx/GppA phosphatase family protein n=1 Tax=Aminomonas paucivorans TaxID=81412 RepID=UPI0033289E2D
MEPVAVLDLGTNSIKLLVAREEGGRLVPLLDRQEIVRLGDGLTSTGVFSPEAMERGLGAVRVLAKQARDLGARRIAAVGTMGFRTARNGEAFAARLLTEAGVEVRVLPGEEEARLAFRAASSRLGIPGPRVVFDTGGGSTEFILGSPEGISLRRSLPLGALFLHDRFLAGEDPVSFSSCEAACRAAREGLAEAAELIAQARPLGPVLVGVGGTVTTLVSVALGLTAYDPDRVTGFSLEAREVRRQIDLYRSLKVEERKALPGLHPKRAEIVLAGACIVEAVLDAFDAPALVASDRGLRYGVLEALLAGERI